MVPVPPPSPPTLVRAEVSPLPDSLPVAPVAPPTRPSSVSTTYAGFLLSGVTANICDSDTDLDILPTTAFSRPRQLGALEFPGLNGTYHRCRALHQQQRGPTE
jgi:hypothetical protein